MLGERNEPEQSRVRERSDPQSRRRGSGVPVESESEWPYILYLSLLHHLETKLSTPLVPHIPTYAKPELSGSQSSVSVSKALRVRVFVSSDSTQHQCTLAASPFSLLSLGN